MNDPARAFAKRFAGDCAAGEVPPLCSYLNEFPGAEREIADEYAAALSKEWIDERSRGVDAHSLGRLRAGSQFGRFTIKRAIGSGGEGKVFEAVDSATHRTVALKVMSSPARLLGRRQERRLRFQRAAKAVAKLDHPGICPVDEFGEEKDLPWMLMPLVEGECLRNSIRRSRASKQHEVNMTLLSLGDPPGPDDDAPAAGAFLEGRRLVERLIRFVESAAHALHFAHEAGLVHRDVKPGNILVSPLGHAVILDFGLASIDDDAQQDIVTTEDLVGSPAYMSPEQLRSDQPKVDRRTDIYSLGVTLYECLTLRRPFAGPTRSALFRAIEEGRSRDVRCDNPLVWPDLARILDRALAIDPERRYRSALEFAENLRIARMGLPSATRAISATG